MARHVIQNQQLLGLYAMEEGRNKMAEDRVA
jgi:hypothetical protein